MVINHHIPRTTSAQIQPDPHRYTLAEKGKAKVVPEPTPIPSDDGSNSDEDTGGTQTQALLAFRQKAISRTSDSQPVVVEVTEDDDGAESQLGAITQAMMEHRQRAIAAWDLGSHTHESGMDNATDESEMDVQYGLLTQAMLAHREKAIGGRHPPASDIASGEGDGRREHNAINEDAKVLIADGDETREGARSARPSPSRYRDSVSKDETPLLLSPRRPSGQQPQGDVPELDLSARQGRSPVVSNVNRSRAPAPRIPRAFAEIRNPRIAKALARMSRKFEFIPEDVLDTFNFFGGDLQKTNNLLERNRKFLDDQSQNETLQ